MTSRNKSASPAPPPPISSVPKTPEEPRENQESPPSERQISAKCQIAILGIGSTDRIHPERFADEGALLEADGILSGVRDWGSVNSSLIQTALLKPYYTPLKVIGWIGSISDPLPITPHNQIQAEQLNLRGVEITIVDADHRALKTLIAPVDGFGTDLYELQRQNRRVVFCGAVVLVNTPRRQEPRFFLWEVIPTYTALDLIGVDDEDALADVEQILRREGKKPYGILAHIRRELIRGSGIRGIDDFPELSLCVDAMILQAFSDGINPTPHYSNKIHTLVIGPPGIGKKFLIEIAKVLNPVFSQASAVTGKLSVAGLVGTAVGAHAASAGTRISHPGYLPMSSGGVLALSDFHQLKGNREAVLAALAEAMEDGSATDSTSARTRHEAETSIHVDLNRALDVQPAREVDSYEDINIPQNVISRFDLIIDLPGDLERRLKPMEEAFAEGTVLSSQMVEAKRPAGQREVQLLVAYMRAHWREVRVPPDVNAYIFNRVKQEFGLVKGGSSAMDQRVLEGSIARTARSVQKLIKAIACADHKLTATKEDVDRALVFIRAKVHFLSTYREIKPAPFDPRKRRIHDRVENILQAFGRQEFTTGQAEAIQGATEDVDDVKTRRQRVTRDLDRLVAEGRLERVGHGRWRRKDAVDQKELRS
jgi:hypothetical protein